MNVWGLTIIVAIALTIVSAILSAGMMYHAWGLWPTSWFAFWGFTFINATFGFMSPFIMGFMLENFSDE